MVDWTVGGREEALRKYVKEGLSAREIARRLDCGASRSAVIGKVSRLGLSLGGGGAAGLRLSGDQRRPRSRSVQTAAAHAVARRLTVERSAPIKPATTGAPRPKLTVIEATPRSMLQGLRYGECKWPREMNPDVPATANTLFCCAPVAPPREDGSDCPYCPAHEARAHGQHEKMGRAYERTLRRFVA